MKVTKGQILAVTQGEYSDYYLKDHFRALKDFDTDELSAKYKKDLPEGDADVYLGWEATWDQDKFLAWAQQNQKLIEPLTENEVQEWYIGTYGDLK